MTPARPKLPQSALAQADSREREPRLERLRAAAHAANVKLPATGLVTLTWGNASAIDRELGLVAIKPSGVPYEVLTVNDIVLVDLDGAVVQGSGRPSTDTPTHLALYRAFATIGGVVHTHSTWATAWAQAEREIPLLGTTHADLSAHPIPLTRALTAQEIERDYEAATGRVLVESISGFGPEEQPCALVRQHGPFCWGPDVDSALSTAVTLEEVARLATLTEMLGPRGDTLDAALLRKHYERKHGPSAYYGQPPEAH
ncbi:MAG TPA: L-ribulose-5-phosphate 4-epimerase AraD [Solirubrobacteraceae bacterium]|nr:L-ribulose-5-phosphate 4-epimerase AraD [Solirubrobacteraceae bacterium]